MRSFLLLNLLTLFTFTSLADPFSVPKDEIGKKGVYTIEQPGVPKHADYEEIYRHNHGRKLKLAPGGKFYQLQFEKAKFKLVIPETYSKDNPPGLLYLGFGDTIDSKIDDVIEFCKPLLKQRNLIAIAVDHKLREPGDAALNNNPLEIHYEHAMLIRRTVDIVRERYTIDSERIIGYAGMLKAVDFSVAAISCPKIFKYNALYTLLPPFYDNMPSPDNKKMFPSFGAQDQEITTLKEARKNKFLFFNLNLPFMLDANKKAEQHLKKFLKDTKFSNSEIFTIDNKNEDERNTYPEIFLCVDKIDPKPFNAKTYLENAQNFEKKNNLPKAFENYKIAANYGFKEAVEKFTELNKDLQKIETEMMKSHLDKFFPEAYSKATEILKKFGANSSIQAANIYKTYSQDKKIILEIKAAAFLEKAKAASKKPNPPTDKIKEACKKVIKTVPGTKTAEKAQALLDSLK